jgi:hypothetical protein
MYFRSTGAYKRYYFLSHFLQSINSTGADTNAINTHKIRKNIFLSFKSYYSSTKFKSSSQYSYVNTLINRQPFETSGNAGTDDPINIWGVNLEAGYIVNKNFSDFHFLSGLTISYSNYRDIDFSSSGQEGFEDVKSTTANFVLPLYLDYHLTPRISFFGGINYYYNYNNENIKLRYNGTDNQNSGYYISRNSLEEKKANTFRSSKVNYLGAEFLHKSGLLLQVSFQDDMANFKHWDFTLGYKF